MNAMKKGLGMEGMPGPFFMYARYRRIYVRSSTGADSRSLSIINVRLSTLGNVGSVVQSTSESWGEAFPQSFFFIASISF